ncbi:DUF2946 family protein [Methyloversatilis sp.]|uniref:DUF2946 family protein n=1 Tax=Methyloversatilis sp. TaxID=2569862 RepID=UPI0035B206E8
MSPARPGFRLALMLALFAVCAQALLPTLMRWQQSADPTGMAQICTAFGIGSASTGEQGDEGSSARHCPWCVAQSLAALPTQAVHAVFALHAERQTPPPVLSTAVTAATLLAPSPRAPPALA